MQSKHKYNFAVIIGRFQPFHNAHLRLVQDALAIANHVILVVGSYNTAPSIRNPWSANQRIGMVHEVLLYNNRVSCVTVRDYLYNDNIWLRELQNQVALEISKHHTENVPKVALMGHHKDDTSYYLNLFPQWDYIEHPTITEPEGTTIRDNFFSKRNELWVHQVPGPVADWLRDYQKLPDYLAMVKEYDYVDDYKARWASAPFKPTFNTTDAVVICSGHVLVVKRKVQPGKGLYALPGGFITQRETVVDGMLRELCEETQLNQDVGRTPYDAVQYLRGRIRDQKVFDHPDRSSRGRTITHAFCLDLGQGPLPHVKGADDAAEAQWMSLMEVGMNEPRFFEDHLHIITHFASKF